MRENSAFIPAASGSAAFLTARTLSFPAPVSIHEHSNRRQTGGGNETDYFQRQPSGLMVDGGEYQCHRKNDQYEKSQYAPVFHFCSTPL
jgi:hypothetical protein